MRDLRDCFVVKCHDYNVLTGILIFQREWIDQFLGVFFKGNLMNIF